MNDLTAKEKAKKIMVSYAKLDSGHTFNHDTKQCALICIDEIIKGIYGVFDNPNDADGKVYYWITVKEEIKKY